MAQTTSAIPKGNYKVEMSADGSTWVDISGVSATVQPGGGERQIGEQHTAEGDVPLITKGKRASKTLEINAVYTEDAAEAFEVLYALYVAGTDYYFRFSPAGGATGDNLFTTANAAGAAAAAVIENCTEPEMDAGSGDPAMIAITIRCPQFLQGAVA